MSGAPVFSHNNVVIVSLQGGDLEVQIAGTPVGVLSIDDATGQTAAGIRRMDQSENAKVFFWAGLWCGMHMLRYPDAWRPVVDLATADRDDAAGDIGYALPGGELG